jgi:hypothetical protein
MSYKGYHLSKIYMDHGADNAMQGIKSCCCGSLLGQQANVSMELSCVLLGESILVEAELSDTE